MSKRSGTTKTLIGRSVRPLGPVTWQIAAPPDVVFDVVADPYLRRTPRALRDKLDVWERGSDMALAAHFTPTIAGRGSGSHRHPTPPSSLPAPNPAQRRYRRCAEGVVAVVDAHPCTVTVPNMKSACGWQ